MEYKILNENIQKIADIIKNSDCLLIVAGAGMGIDSGLPDYRGPNGLWNTWHPAKTLNMTYDKLSTHENFIEDPELAWGFQSYLTKLYHNLDPHNGYNILLNIAKEFFSENYFVLTSNVDSQFKKSGFDINKLYEVHGTKRLWQCIDKNCNKKHFPWDMNINQLPKINPKTLYAEKPLPKCIYCGKMARPNVSFFGDLNFSEKSTKIQKDKLEEWLKINKSKKLAILEMGCGKSIHSIRFVKKRDQFRMMSNEFKLPKCFLSDNLTTLIRINPDDNQLDEENKDIIVLNLGSKKGMEMISRKLNKN